MSPSATGGPPHTRAASASGGGPITTTKADMKAYGVDGGKNPNKIWPHHDDLVSAIPGVDINSPIGTVLKEADQLAKAADTSLDFRRPDIALQEYVKASIIAAEMIPRHKDFPRLQADRGDLHRIYIALTKRIKAQDEKFMEVKKMIKENNALHATQPNIRMGTRNIEKPSAFNGRENGHVKCPSNDTNQNGSPRKKPPPPVQPKPDALHGKSIQNARNESNITQPADLAARFARLRSPEPQVQDPRIRTRPITVPLPPNSNSPSPLPPNSGNSTMARPTGPREMPSVPKTIPGSGKITVNIDLPLLPKAPDAVYSPARGTENSATANLPSSQRANSYSGSGKHFSAPPISTVGPTPSHVEKPDYFSPAHTIVSTSQTRNSSKRQKLSLPVTTTITAEDLMTYLGQGSQGLQVLLVDLRNREDFDNGHIMSQSIICVEPITLRHGMSGQELEDCMVIAPDIEQRLFEQRNNFDLIVVYDQSSKSMKTSDLNTKLLDFATAVYDYGYDKKLKHYPVLLHGGLDAWSDLLGPRSLETSSTGSVLIVAAPNGIKKARPFNSIPMARDSKGAFLAKTKKYQSRPLSKEEENKWVSALQQENENEKSGASSDELIYARTTEDFFRRYPELPSIQESMVSPVLKSSVHPIEAELARTTPNPPVRPPPALPRQRSSGISERQTMVNYAHSVNSLNSISITQKPPGLTGLHNPGNLCYLNTAVQGLSCTPLFRKLQIVAVRAKVSELNGGTPPQLMAKCVKNLISHLWSGQWDYVNPKTFRAYVNAVHARFAPNRPQDAFGGLARQHDSSEFLRFLLQILDDELNPTRSDLVPFKATPEHYRQFWEDYPTIEAAAEGWRAIEIPSQTSILAKSMTVISVRVLTCDVCHKETRLFNGDVGTLTLKTPLHPKRTTLMAILHGETGDEPGFVGIERVVDDDIKDRECDFCDTDSRNAGTAPQRRTYTIRDWLAVLPETFVIILSRERIIIEGDMIRYEKVNTRVTFTERIDFNRCRPQGEAGANRIYEVYAVAVHRGRDLQAGHYYLIGRDPTVAGSPWYKYNDSRVSRSSFQETQDLEEGAHVCYIFLQKCKGP